MSKNIRKAISQSEYIEGNFGIVSIEITIFSIFVGLQFQSLAIGGITWLALCFGLRIKLIGLLYMTIMSIIWTYVAFRFSGTFTDIWGQVVVGIIVFLISTGVHFTAIEYMEDISDFDYD